MDGVFLRSLVAIILLCETFHQVVILHATYHYLILGFAQPLITTLVWSLPMQTIMNGILSLLLFSFLTHRLWRLSRHAYLAACGALLTAVSIAVTVAYGIRGFRYHNLFQAEKALRTHGIFALSISLAADLCISTSLCYYLHRSRAGWRKSDDIITKLIALTITTGMLTTLCKLVDLIAYITAHDNLYVLFFNFMVGKRESVEVVPDFACPRTGRPPLAFSVRQHAVDVTQHPPIRTRTDGRRRHKQGPLVRRRLAERLHLRREPARIRCDPHHRGEGLGV
ncbi:hypothetical protein LXA43DRAFT_442270 [Ganoderma leucocontextum]|nr:hypothetical protein LXA43DRAFT_442270 [Ganoderma leucocontextum]